MVASDGFSYERSAIKQMIDGGNRVSPFTRERLRLDVLVPNLYLKKRILEFDGNVLDAAETVSRRRDETEASLRQQVLRPNSRLTLTLALALALTLTLTL